MIADSFSKLRFIELCLIFFRSVYRMACKNDVIVLTHVDPIFEAKHRLTLRGLLYAPHFIHYQRRKRTTLEPVCHVMQKESLLLATCMLTK